MGRRIVNQLACSTAARTDPGNGSSFCAFMARGEVGPYREAILPGWEALRRNYYTQMGWDAETGRPLPETLEKLGLEHTIADLKQ